MIDRSIPSYVVQRTGEETWTINGVSGQSLENAVKLCEKFDHVRGFDWDFDTYGEARDGLSALKIGESLTVTYPDEEDAA